jgi:hypothetical protein
MQLLQLFIDYTQVEHGYLHASHNPVVEVLTAAVPFGQTVTHVLFDR